MISYCKCPIYVTPACHKYYHILLVTLFLENFPRFTRFFYNWEFLLYSWSPDYASALTTLVRTVPNFPNLNRRRSALADAHQTFCSRQPWSSLFAPPWYFKMFRLFQGIFIFDPRHKTYWSEMAHDALLCCCSCCCYGWSVTPLLISQ